MTRHLVSITLLLVISILFSACKKVDDIIEEQLGENAVIAKINGENFSASELLVTAEYDVSSTGVHTLGLVAAKLPLNGVTEGIALAIVSTDSSGINVGDTYTAKSITKVGAGEYTVKSDNQDVEAYSSNTDVATIIITAIDMDQKTISGTFSFDGADEDAPSTIYEVRDGEFKDISFE